MVTLAAIRTVEQHPPFDAAVVRGYLVKIGKPVEPYDAENIATALNQHLINYAVDRLRWLRDDPAQIHADAKRIADACLKVLTTAGVGEGPVTDETLKPHLGAGALYAAAASRGETRGRAATLNALTAVQALFADARRIEDRTRHKRRRSRSNRPLDDAIQGIARMYFEAWGRRPTVSRVAANGEPSGSFVSLLGAFFDVAWRAKIDDRRVNEQLAKRWERSDGYQEWRDIDEIASRAS